MIDSAQRYGDDFGAQGMWGLKELALPDAVGWLPLAPGWYVLAGFVLVALGWVGWRRWRRWQRNAYRRSAARQVAGLSGLDASRALPQILRRVALQSARRVDVAALRGAPWIDWLNSRARTELFEFEDAARLDALAYGHAAVGADELHDLKNTIIQWLKQHRADV